MNAYNLIKRTIENFEERGYNVNIIIPDAEFAIGERKGKGERRIYTSITYRHNGAPENVTVTMEVIETINEEFGIGKVVSKIKIPKNASDKVLNNRIDKILSIYDNRQLAESL